MKSPAEAGLKTLGKEARREQPRRKRLLPGREPRRDPRPVPSGRYRPWIM
jgi:hypothetical protein